MERSIDGGGDAPWMGAGGPAGPGARAAAVGAWLGGWGERGNSLRPSCAAHPAAPRGGRPIHFFLHITLKELMRSQVYQGHSHTPTASLPSNE